MIGRLFWILGLRPPPLAAAAALGRSFLNVDGLHLPLRCPLGPCPAVPNRGLVTIPSSPRLGVVVVVAVASAVVDDAAAADVVAAGVAAAQQRGVRKNVSQVLILLATEAHETHWKKKNPKRQRQHGSQERKHNKECPKLKT